jgi:hypothetical protein
MHCDMVLTRREREEGWCDSCGKKLPVSTKRGVSPRAETPAAAPVQPARKRGFFMTFLLLLPCMAVGAAVALAITGGKTSGGFSGITAGVGMALGYAFGILPNKSSKETAA